ncbi:MAG: CehA/McbA family metallohydrolase [Verrucomicrobia bacterium]|nr:CehA/McbA family metallohydrolase [Verrucomicrobiota bacterium]
MKSACIVVFALLADAAFGQYHLYWGDMHGHSALSDGKGSPDDYFTHARDVARLDFAILTDHDFGNGRPEWHLPTNNWTLIQETADGFTVPGRFVAVGGYEWTSQEKYWSGLTNGPSERLFPGLPRHYNHKNVYFPSRVDYLFSAKDPAYHTPDRLAVAVLKHGGLIHNDHPDAAEAGRDQFDYAPAHAAVIANSEIYPDTILYQGKSFPVRGEETLRAFLNRGGRTGFVAGTDSHEGKPAARTAVLARALTRAAIFDALRHRRNYAINHTRIGLDFRINGHFMGEEIELTGKPRIAVEVKGTAPIEEIVIVRNGEVIQSRRPRKPKAAFTYVDRAFAGPSYYYVRVIQTDTDPHGNHSHAWSSPIWVRPNR